MTLCKPISKISSGGIDLIFNGFLNFDTAFLSPVGFSCVKHTNRSFSTTHTTISLHQSGFIACREPQGELSVGIMRSTLTPRKSLSTGRILNFTESQPNLYRIFSMSPVTTNRISYFKAFSNNISSILLMCTEKQKAGLNRRD